MDRIGTSAMAHVGQCTQSEGRHGRSHPFQLITGTCAYNGTHAQLILAASSCLIQEPEQGSARAGTDVTPGVVGARHRGELHQFLALQGSADGGWVADWRRLLTLTGGGAQVADRRRVGSRRAEVADGRRVGTRRAEVADGLDRMSSTNGLVAEPLHLPRQCAGRQPLLEHPAHRASAALQGARRWAAFAP